MGEIALRSVVKRFGDTLVLDDVSLTIGREEFVVVLGPSGCGKSTLLRVIAGLESIDSGQILIEGARVDHLAPGKRGVAMVFQGYALYPHMSVRNNIAFGLRNIGMPAADIGERIAGVARMLELEPLLDRLPSQLSGGQRQRVAIARAVVKDPQVFMFDEPLSNLDAALRGRMRQEIASLHRRIRTAMIFVTHDQTEAMTLADRIVVMNQKRIEQIGTPAQIYQHPASLFVATFIGSPAMNILAATRAEVAGGSGARVRLANGTELDLPASVPLPATAELRVGVRPEALRLTAPGAGRCDARLEFIEYLGDKRHCFMSLSSGDQLVALADVAQPLSIGDTVGVSFDASALHLFDGNGRNCRPAA